MSTISDIYKYATLATASYVRAGALNLGSATFASEFVSLANSQSDGRLPTSLGEKLFVRSDANPVVWNIVSYYGGDAPEWSSDKSGFGATLFQNSDTHEKVLALRGTEPTEDPTLFAFGYAIKFSGTDLISADLGQIGILGVALTQLVSLANYVMLLRAPQSDAHVPQLEVKATFVLPPEGVAYVTAQGTTFDIEGTAIATPVYITFTRKVDGQGLELLQPTDTVMVTGHSLGGELAVMAAKLFPDIFQQNVVVFNAAGYDPATANTGWLDATGAPQLIKSVLADELGTAAGSLDTHANMLALPSLAAIEQVLGRNATLGTPVVVAVNSEDLAPGDDASLVASASTGADKYGTPVNLPTEEDNHVIEPFMDALALQAAIEPMTGSGFGTNELTQVLRASANENNRSYEEFAERLFGLLLNGQKFLGGASRLPLSDEMDAFGTGKGSIDARNAFHDAVLRIQDAVKAKPLLRMLSLTDIPADGLKNLALNGGVDALAYRYALKELNPFVIVGDPSIYAAHNASGELNLYINPSSTPAGMTSQYIADRAAFLHWKNLANVADLGFYADADPDSVNWLYVDRPQAFKVKVNSATQVPEDPARVAMFGGDGTDALVGGLVDDRLYGGMGTDFLAGGAGDDYLEGGAGFDVYQYSASKSLLGDLSNGGVDQIRDTDGKGLVRYEFVEKGILSDTVTSGAVAGVGIKLSDTQWQSPDGKFTYTQQLATGALEVSINGDAGGTIRVLDFDFAEAQTTGFLGIRLVDVPGLPVPARVIEGDLEPLDVDPNSPGTQTGTDEFGNVLLTTNPAPDRADTLFGSDGQNGSEPNDNIIAGGGDDIVNSWSGDDIVQGGPGRDTIDAGIGNDLVEAGANGSEAGDIVQGGDGADRLYADARFDPAGTVAAELAAALTAGESQTASGFKGDFLSAGADSYAMTLGMGRDTIQDDSPSAAETGTLALAQGLSLDSLKARQVDEDLAVDIHGTTDGVLIEGYFAPGATQNWQIAEYGGALTAIQDLVDRANILWRMIL